MKKQVLFLFLMFLTFQVFGQQPALPTGAVPYGSQYYKAPDGSVWMGATGKQFTRVTEKRMLDSLATAVTASLALKENISNKATNLTAPDNIKYPSTLAVTTGTIQNQTAVTQTAGFRIDGTGTLGAVSSDTYSNTTTSLNARLQLLTTGSLITRNIADINPTLIVNSALGTGNIQNWQQAGTTVASVNSVGDFRGTGFGNSTSTSNGYLLLGAGSAPSFTRNVADANSTLLINNANASSTGDVTKFQSGGVDVAIVEKSGRIQSGAAPVNGNHLTNKTYVDSKVSGDLANYQLLSGKGAANGYAGLDAGSKLLLANIPDALLGSVNYQGSYNASTNTPALPSAVGNKGYYYVVNTAGTQESLTFAIGDWIISNGTIWQKVDNNNAVTSVAGKVGAVTLAKGDVGLGNVDNTSDINKPLSIATINGLAVKESLSNKSDLTALGTSNVLYPTQNAVKVYVDNAITGNTGASDLALGTRTNTTLPITNSNGTGVTLPEATTSLAGLISGTNQTKLNAITGTNTGDQTLSLGSLTGQISISGSSGNSVSLSSLNRISKPDANTETAAGFTHYLTTGGTNYPSATGSGIRINRNGGTDALGTLDIWQPNAGGYPYLRYGTGIAAYSPWERIATQDWANTNLANQTLTYTGVTAGQIGISGGNTVLLTALNQLPTNIFASASDIPTNGLFPYNVTTGSTGYPTTGVGSGIKSIRVTSTSPGAFEFYKSTSNDGNTVYMRSGTVGTGYTPFEALATQPWVNTATVGLSNTTGGSLISASTPDLNTATTTSRFYATGALNRPEATNGVVTNDYYASGSGFASQTYQSVTAGDRYYYRSMASGVYDTWYQVASRQWANGVFAPIVAGGYLPLSGGTLTGALNGANATFSGLLQTNSEARINGGTSTNRVLRFTTGPAVPLTRWALIANATAESGSNAGSDFTINRYDDAGSSLGAALTINRATGNVTFGGSVLGSVFGNTASTSNARLSLASTGPLIDRNIADANPTLSINNIHASSTGNVVSFQSGGVNVASINKAGNVTSAAAPTIGDHLVNKTYADGSYVKTTGNETIAGIKTFSGISNFNSVVNVSGAELNVTSSGSVFNRLESGRQVYSTGSFFLELKPLINFTATRTQNYQDASGTIALTSDLPTSGTFTPTLSVSGTGTAVNQKCFYTKVGTVVTVYGSLGITGAVAAENIQVLFDTLPVAGSISVGEDVAGVGSILSNYTTTVTASASPTKASLTTISPNTSYTIKYTFSYQAL